MRVHIYKMGPEVADVMVESSPGKGRAPVVVRHISPENVVGKVGPIIVAMRKPKEGKPAPVPA